MKKERLAVIVSNKMMTETELCEALTIVRDSDGIPYSKQKVQEYIRLAKSAIPDECKPELKKSFESLADYILKRTF